MFRLLEVKGDLFEGGLGAMGHCVSKDFFMGKGIAVEFKNRFQRVNELKAQGKAVGQVAALWVDAGKEFSFWVYYLITKERYFHKPTYATLRAALEDTKAHLLAHQVTRLSIPRIGCGLDGLDWTKVKALLQSVFADLHLDLIVYTL